MITPKLQGFFNVRNFKNGVERKNQTMKGDNENIKFDALFAAADIPENLKPFAHYYGENNERAAVTFKIGKNCRWFDKFAQPTNRPSAAFLDAGKFDVMVDFSALEGNPSDKLSPRGLWVNSIMFDKVPDNPFAGNAFCTADDETAPIATPPIPMGDSPKEEIANPFEGVSKAPAVDDLPF